MKTARLLFIILGIFTVLFFTVKKKIEVIQNFDSEKYLGKWYEIARLDYKWEKGLNNVTASYSLNDNGTIKVDNKGFDYASKKWKESVGKAKFSGSRNEGKLEVSFFGPFYADYNIVAIDPNYKHALVLGRNTDYMWILSRESHIPETIRKEYLLKAKQLGVDTEKLVWVEHSAQK